ncbi:hypothetical protein NVI2019_PEGOAJLN_01050 [Providencia alcalifaciens]|uniref:hypothetical protein n=1 Tax=Providencia alcalifaciens TaxID=126385 RepID=UPI00044EDBC7|nr:hypothetical protein [Providencia alcalifaciens]EUD04407.1 hypothetical protein HMPREF1565_0142 [Providencia alcalifaciens RIMD 1656011]CAG9414026.1 hypothetical protein NVI2019_PEGOAJLN_01050 [Providencia alcalifaciens]
MMSKITLVNEASEFVLQKMNHFFQCSGNAIRIRRMNKENLKYCHINSLSTVDPLAWLDYSEIVLTKESFSFCFKLISRNRILVRIPDKPAGGCVCSYDPHSRRATIELLQNFEKKNKVLDGKMMTYSLVSILFFLIKVEGDGIYINNPVSEDLLDYYVAEFGFQDVFKDGSLLYSTKQQLFEVFNSLRQPWRSKSNSTMAQISNGSYEQNADEFMRLLISVAQAIKQMPNAPKGEAAGKRIDETYG